MKKALRRILVYAMSFSLVFQGGFAAAHSGRTDSAGGHHDYQNASGLGSYHYHHGYGPHLHSNGACPYETSSDSSSDSELSYAAQYLLAKKNKQKKTNKKYQKMLNRLGYKCGKADGILGKTSKKAIRKFQQKYKLAVTGKLNKKTKKIIKKRYNVKF